MSDATVGDRSLDPDLRSSPDTETAKATCQSSHDERFQPPLMLTEQQIAELKRFTGGASTEFLRGAYWGNPAQGGKALLAHLFLLADNGRPPDLVYEELQRAGLPFSRHNVATLISRWVEREGIPETVSERLDHVGRAESPPGGAAGPSGDSVVETDQVGPEVPRLRCGPTTAPGSNGAPLPGGPPPVEPKSSQAAERGRTAAADSGTAGRSTEGDRRTAGQAETLSVSESDSPLMPEPRGDRGAKPVVLKEETRIERTLGILKGRSKGKTLVKLIDEQPDRKVTLKMVISRVYLSGRDPTPSQMLTRSFTAKQLIRRTTEALCGLESPWRMEYDWNQDEIKLVELK
jgi:hypothetical protein